MLHWIMFLFGLDLILSMLRGRQYKFHSIVRWLQLIFCWLPPTVLAIFWTVIVGRWIFLMLAWPLLLALVGLIFRLRRQAWRREWVVHAVGLIFVSAALLFSGMTVSFLVFFYASIGLLLLLIRTLRRNEYLNCPFWLPLIALSIYGACMFQALFVYIVDERDRREEVVRQPGVQVLALQDYDRDGMLDSLNSNIIRAKIFPITDLSAFLLWGDNLLLLPQHMNTVVRLDRYGPGEALPTDDVTADNLAVDFYRRQFYFVVGSQLFRGSFDGLTFEPVWSFDLERAVHKTPNIIDGFFNAETALVMVQYEYDNAVMIYDVLDDYAYRVEIHGYRMRNSLWHPDGDKIIAVGSMSEKSEGHLFVFNLRGEIVQDVVTQFHDLTFIAHGWKGTIFLTQFIGGQVAEWSTDPLEPRAEFATPAGARSTLEPPGSGCLLVSSFLRGTLNVYRLDDRRLLRSLYIGRRARSIQPSLEDDSFLIATSVGLLKIDGATLLQGCSSSVDEP
ncbi:MAG TPA: WD40 repeat domain-containing protein [bacterium]|nr:WD40 repeat domain-containing protein [bacterium]